ncbi:MAG: molybdopterin-dependent oxidoreductase [Chitinophagales bacterium]|nr:molybdopterin-dependent oxidoreductase [Hyphomicrobiales bacterium]
MTPAAIRTTCPYCGVGCGVLVRPDSVGGAETKGDIEHPANFGRLCSKGSALGETLGLRGRLLHPQIDGKRVAWDEALDHVGSELSRIRAAHGPGAIAFYLSGQLLTEDYYVANKLAKGFIGTPHVDTNSRLCMASSVAGHKRAFGADVVPQCYEDLDEADLVVLAGSNAAWCHPILYQRIQKARERGARVVNIDPRRTATSEGADLQLSITPGMDQFLWNGLLVWLANNGARDHDFIERHTEGLTETLAEARAQSPDAAAVADATGLREADVRTFYEWFVQTPRVVTCYSQGVNQSAQGTDKVNAILNCHLATGRIGKRGSGPLSFTGQPNAMGGREVGGMANMLAAHMGFSAEDLDRVARFWQAPNLVTGEGLKTIEMFDAIADGRIKALWVMGTNPAVSLPDADRVAASLKKLELFVVSENVASNDTVNLAPVRLPAAAWGEKDGTVTNSERRISRQRSFLPIAGEARADWRILSDVAARMGWGASFSYRGPADIFREHAALSGFENSGERAFDISALEATTEDEYEALAPFQWPWPRGRGQTQRLFAGGHFFTATRKARFIPTAPAKLASATSTEFPLVLNTGRIRDQWHTMTRTGKSPRLSTHIAEPFAEMHPDDATRTGVQHGELARIQTVFGNAVVRVNVSLGQKRGSVFMPIHWSAENASKARASALIHAKNDPFSGQPEAKATPARVSVQAAEYYGIALSRQRLNIGDCTYSTNSETGSGHASRFALAGPPDDWLAWALRIGGDGEAFTFQDAETGVFRFALMHEGLLAAVMFIEKSPALPALGALERMFEQDLTALQHRRAIMAGRPGGNGPLDGPAICICFQVGEARLAAAIASGANSVDEIGARLNAGTNCGSCIPEIRRLIKSAAPFAAAAE